MEMHRFSMGELGSQSPEVQPIRTRQMKKRRRAESGSGTQISDLYKKEVEKEIRGIGDQLDIFGSRLSRCQAETIQITELITEKVYRSRVGKYGGLVGKLRDECLASGISAEEFAKGFGADKDYVRRAKEGRITPSTAEDVRQMVVNLEGSTRFIEKTGFTPERQAELEGAAEEACDARKDRKELRTRLDTAEAKLQRKADLEADLAACAGALKKKIASLKQQLAASSGQAQSLRRRLELAEAALRRAAARREVLKDELVACAIGLLKVIPEVKRLLDL